jgi:ubiquinone/menaquinone biosynthesis C-methylase UbiE
MARQNHSNVSVDLAGVAFVFHEVDPPERLTCELRRVLRPGARVAVLEWHPDAESDQGPPRAHRLTPEQVITWLRAAGLEAHETWHDADAYLLLTLPQTNDLELLLQ